MITETAGKWLKKTPPREEKKRRPARFMEGTRVAGAAQEEIKKQKAKNHATRSDFTLDSSAIESQRLQHDVVIVARIWSVERQTKGKLKNKRSPPLDVVLVEKNGNARENSLFPRFPAGKIYRPGPLLPPRCAIPPPLRLRSYFASKE